MPPIRIEGKERPISEIFSSQYVFTIPRYQRPYSWTTEQAGELLEDLLTAMGDETSDIDELDPYFLGSIVLAKEEHKPEAEVIDGQQRLATLVILLSVIRSLSTDEDYARAIEQRLYEPADAIMGTPNRYRLTLRPQDQDFFRRYIQDRGGLDELAKKDPATLTDSQRNIRANALLYKAELAKLSESQRRRLAGFLLRRCFVVVISTPTTGSAFRVFLVLNDRGLDLSTPDILKAEVIGAIDPSEADEYARRWDDVEEQLGRDEFERLFAHIRMIYRKTKLRRNLLDEFRSYVQPAKSPKQFIDEVLKPYAEAFYTVMNASYESTHRAERVNVYLRWLKRIDNGDWIPTAMEFLSRYRDDPDRLSGLLRLLERLAAGLMILRANVNQRIERYGQVLRTLENGADLFEEGSPLQLTSQEKHEILKRLDGDVYTQLPNHVCKYVLLRLDSALSGGEATYELPHVTVEHVLPRVVLANSQWANWWPTFDTRWQWVNKLGNLVLLARYKNSEAQNYPFDEKKRRYFMSPSGTSPFALTTQVLNESEWTPEVVQRRQRYLMDVLRRLWELG